VKKEHELLAHKDFAYDGIYDMFIVPFKFERLVFNQTMLHTCALIYNLVWLPLRVFYTVAVTAKSFLVPRSLKPAAASSP
jgi:hypothetical protein